MIEVKITPEMLDQAKEMSNFTLTRKSEVESPNNKLIGCLGEVMLLQTFDSFKSRSTFNYDIVSDSGSKVEVKTLLCKFKPKENYEANVIGYTKDWQKPDVYVFTRLVSSFDKGWIVGWMPSVEFFQRATLHPKGERRADGFVYRTDTYMMLISELNKFQE